MYTCRIRSYLEAHLPADIARGISDDVDIIPIQTSLDCSKLPGLDIGVLELSPNLTIIQGGSCGRTRILEALKSAVPRNVTIPPFPKMDLSRLSLGEKLFEIIHALVEILPDDGCLLLDDVLEFLDRDRAEKLIVFIAGQGKQVVMTGRCHRIDALRTCINLSFRLVERTNSVPALIQCWC